MRKQKRENRGQLTVTMSVAALIVFFTLMGTSLSARWEVFYEANVLPDDVSLGDNVWTTKGQGFHEIDPPGILYIKTEDSGCSFWRQLDGLSKVTIEARIKVVTSPTGSTATMVIEKGAQWFMVAVYLFDDKIKLGGRTGEDGPPAYDVDMTNGYHIVRLVIDVVKDGTDVKVYLDNKEKPILEHQFELIDVQKYRFWGKVNGKFIFTTAPKNTEIDENGKVVVRGGSVVEISSTNPNFTIDDAKMTFTPPPRLHFGCSVGNKQSESYWDYVAYTAGAFSPRELHSQGREVAPQGKISTTWGAIRTVR
ncbi:MAG: hypothetical protein JRJ62_05955 [Deltaproteobacteria bacterium]|nr:hypothetical protein [Deltaproteobacteria bacterium]